MFFPILKEGHWVLVCVNMFIKQICFFDSLGSSMHSSLLEAANNLTKNSAATTIECGVLKQDVASFQWVYPDCPKQDNLCDCGLYIMEFMDSFDGFNNVDSALQKASSLAYRMVAAAALLNSQYNMVKQDGFQRVYDDAMKKMSC